MTLDRIILEIPEMNIRKVRLFRPVSVNSGDTLNLNFKYIF